MANGLIGEVAVDVDGFLVDSQDWTEELAFELASASGIRELTDDHWAVLRELQKEHISGSPDMFPRVSEVCESLAMETGCVKKLFGDPAVAWRIAGLPKPGIDKSAYMPNSFER